MLSDPLMTIQNIEHVNCGLSCKWDIVWDNAEEKCFIVWGQVRRKVLHTWIYFQLEFNECFTLWIIYSVTLCRKFRVRLLVLGYRVSYMKRLQTFALPCKNSALIFYMKNFWAFWCYFLLYWMDRKLYLICAPSGLRCSNWIMPDMVWLI